MPPGRTVRVEFTEEHDTYLYKYLATYCPTKEGRRGRKIFEQLMANENKQWPWSVHHTWQSWRERYVKNTEHFDRLIKNYQEKPNKKSANTRKRTAEPMPKEMPRRNAKRVKLKEEESSSSETGAATQHNASPSRSKSTAKSLPKHPREPPETPSQALNSPQPINPCRTAPISPPRSNANADASTSATKKPAAHQARDETLEVLPSSPDRQAPSLTEPRSPPRHVKRTKVRLGTPSEIFASEPSSPKMDAAAAVVGVEGPSSQAKPASVGTPIHPSASPRVVDSFHGQVLVDRKGHVPRTPHRGGKDGAEEEEEEEDKARWPPARGSTVKERRTSGPDVQVDAHHAFSQPQPPPRPEAPPESVEAGERQPAKPLLDRRAVVDLFSGPASHFPQVENERREDVVRNGASPVKHIVTTAPPSDPFSGQIPKPLSKVFKFPAPRASTRSPFRPELPAEETRRPPPQPRPQPRLLSRIKAARHPALTRTRRQTIGNWNGREREHRGEVPSVDLVALSHSSMSARSHSHSSAGMSIPTRPPRWSLPAFAHATPWVFDEPSQMYGDLWHGRARTSSLVGTSTPRFMLTPSPTRSIAGGNAPDSHANGIPSHASPSVSLAPHPPDLQLTASHGLASILTHMSANHGLALGVVEAVYKRVGNLREADEVLKGMREAAEGFGEREIERRVRERQGMGMGRVGRNGVDRRGTNGREEGREEERNGNETALRYVAASEDGEASEYSPPETTRAAMWKRQSESSCVEEKGEEGEGDDEEAEDGRAVEEELRDVDEHEDDGEDGIHHDFSRHVPLAGENGEETGQDMHEVDGTQDAETRQEDAWEERRVTEALLEDTRLAQELERKLGKERYRKDIARLFAQLS